MSTRLPLRLLLPIALINLFTLAGLAWYLGRPGCDESCTVPAILLFALLNLLPTAVLIALTAGRDRAFIEQLTAHLKPLVRGEPAGRLLNVSHEPLNQLITTINSLTDQWEAERQTLRTDQQQLAAVLNQIATGVLITDGHGEVQLANPAALELLGLKTTAQLNRSFASIARHHQLIELWRRCREEWTEQIATINMDARGGLFLQAIISPFQERAGQRCLIILQDLTRIRQLETVRRDLISNVSHEFRTPLASLRALVETLQEGALDDPPAAQHFLQRTAHEVDTLTQIVEELLTLSRIEGGQVALRLQPTSVTDLLLATAERFQPQAERQEIDLQLDVPAGLPPVLADEGQILTVLSNLVHNAIKFTPAGGQITLGAKPDQEQLCLYVRDTGEGIPSTDLPRIFERFYKADRARQRQIGGTGLGLAIAKHTVQAHGGQIWAESKERKGSTFFFTLPAA